MDFAQLLRFFEKHDVTFVSVTQNFNTNSSMGRLTLNVLLSFAQFEREIISERTKDKMGAARKRGQWLGGRPPLGYDLDKENKRIVVNEEEAKLVREIFNLYIKGNSLLQVTIIINDKGYRTKYLTYKTGTVFGGKKFGVTHIQWIIRNVTYIGKVSYEGQMYDGQNEAIIDENTFKEAQEKLKLNRRERRATKNKECTGLLSKLLHCKTCNTLMFHTYTLKNSSRKYRYYLCSNAQKRGYNSCPTKSINAQAIEDVVINYLKTMLSNKDISGHPNKQEVEALISPIWDTLYPEEKRRILRTLVKEIDYNRESKKIGITLNESKLRLEFDIDLKQVRPLNKWHKEIEIKKEPTVKKNLIIAFQLQNLLEKKKIEMKQAAGWLNLSYARLSQLLMLNFLSTEIKESILFLANEKLSHISDNSLRKVAAEIDWQKQSQMWQSLLR